MNFSPPSSRQPYTFGTRIWGKNESSPKPESLALRNWRCGNVTKLDNQLEVRKTNDLLPIRAYMGMFEAVSVLGLSNLSWRGKGCGM